MTTTPPHTSILRAEGKWDNVRALLKVAEYKWDLPFCRQGPRNYIETREICV